MPRIRVLKSFSLLGLSEGRELRFKPGVHEVSPEVAGHWFIQQYADGCIESPAQAATRFEREAAAAAQAARQAERDAAQLTRAPPAAPEARANERLVEITPAPEPSPAIQIARTNLAVVHQAPAGFDFRNPNYQPIWADRAARLAKLRAHPELLPLLRQKYAADPAQFINDWGTTFDPRNVERGLPPVVPFVLWRRQTEWINFIMDCWRNSEPGLTDKCRDSGCTWLAIALACTLCLFHRGVVVGFGSRKAEYIDLLGSHKSILEKGRLFLSALPAEFLDGWQRERHSPYMRILFPATGSSITGECGDGIGRGDRTSLYFVDEASHLERADLIDASLSATTNCRQDIGTPNGRGNPFAVKRFSGKIRTFSHDWRSDPRKDQAWYQEKSEEMDPVSFAQEYNLDYSASVEGVLIPSIWVESAVDAHKKLNITPTGTRRAGLDVADEGVDRNAIALRHGILLEHLESWSGKGLDLYATVVKAFDVCDTFKYSYLFYDADGMGAGVRGDARILNQARRDSDREQIHDQPFRGSAAVEDPNGELVPKRKNADYFLNMKAMAWFALRLRFERTWRATVKGLPYNPDDLISIPSDLPELTQLLIELSQPTYSLNSVGKVVVDKAPSGTRSPNLADAVMIAFNPGNHALERWLRLAD